MSDETKAAVEAALLAHMLDECDEEAWLMTDWLWSLKNCVLGNTSSSGFQSASGSRTIFSNRFGGFSAAPRCAEIIFSACTD